MINTGETNTCHNCGAGYEVSYTNYPMRDKDTAECEVCHETMARWNSTSVPSYRLVKRPKAPQAKPE